MTKTLSPDMWKRSHGGKLRRLSLGAKVLYLYLLTSSHTSLSGLSYLPLGLVQAETDLNTEQLNEAMNLLAGCGLAEFDKKQMVWWLPEAIPMHFAKFNKRDNRWKQAQKQADELKHSDLHEQYVQRRKQLGV